MGLGKNDGMLKEKLFWGPLWGICFMGGMHGILSSDIEIRLVDMKHRTSQGCENQRNDANGDTSLRVTKDEIP